MSFLKINTKKRKLSFYFLGLLLPLSIFFSNFLFAISLIVLLLSSPKRTKPRWLTLVVLLIPALIPILSILFHNEVFRLSAVEVKIPFVVIALLIGFTKINDEIISQFKNGFIVGVLIASILVQFSDSSFISYLQSSLFFEFTYISLYIVIALIYLWFTDIEIHKIGKQVLSAIFVLLLINMADSLFITIGGLIVFAAIIIKGTPLQSKLAIGFLVIVFSIFIYKGVEIQHYLHKSSAAQEESGVDKLAQWQCVLEVMKNKELFGVGFGSKENLLTQCYHEHAMFNAETNELNSHNEYLDAFLTLGYIGVLWLLIYFFKILFVAYDTKQVAQLLVIVIIALYSISENVFTRQKGVMITAITTLLIFSSKSKKLDGKLEPSTN